MRANSREDEQRDIEIKSAPSRQDARRARRDRCHEEEKSCTVVLCESCTSTANFVTGGRGFAASNLSIVLWELARFSLHFSPLALLMATTPRGISPFTPVPTLRHHARAASPHLDQLCGQRCTWSSRFAAMARASRHKRIHLGNSGIDEINADRSRWMPAL